MDIGLMSLEITVQKNTVVTDRIGNHTNTWTDWHTCHASVSGENASSNGSEDLSAGTYTDHAGTDFTVRWCEKTKDITTDDFRVVFNGEVYNIIGIDHMQYRRKSVKLRCRKERGDVG